MSDSAERPAAVRDLSAAISAARVTSLIACGRGDTDALSAQAMRAIATVLRNQTAEGLHG